MFSLLLHNNFYSHHDLLKKMIEELELKLAELIAISGEQKQDIHMDFKVYTVLKRILLLLVIFSLITILDRQRTWKMPLFYCVEIVLFILFTRKI